MDDSTPWMPYLGSWVWIVQATACVILVSYAVLRHIAKQRAISDKIVARGGYANSIPSWLPFGVDLIFKDVMGAITHTQLHLWRSCLDCGKGTHTAEVLVLGQRIVFTDDPINIKAILSSQFQDYGKGEPFHNDWHEFLGNSIFTVDGEQWQDARRLLRPQFLRTRLSDLDIFERHVQKVIALIPCNGDTTDLAGIFMRYTMDVSTEFLLGKSTASLENPDQAFARAFAETQRMQNILVRAGPANAIVPRRSFRSSIGVIDAFIQPYIDDALQLAKNSSKAEDSDLTFLHTLAMSTDNQKVLRDQFVAVLLAGRDTTASALSWLFYELSQHPEVFGKLRQEIEERVGLVKAPTADDLKSMKYLKQAIDETLRLYPAVPFNVRMALSDTSLPVGGKSNGDGPVGILKNTAIAYSPLTLQRRSDLWPSLDEYPIDEFCPGRWEDWQPPSWQYLPFNGGPRTCMGQDFALMEIKYTTVRILQTFGTIEPRILPQDQYLKTEIVIQPGAGVPVALRLA